MKELDVRGLSCPEPQMLTEQALKNEEAPLRILVSEPHQKDNVLQVANKYKKTVSVQEKDGYYQVSIE